MGRLLRIGAMALLIGLAIGMLAGRASQIEAAAKKSVSPRGIEPLLRA